MIYLGCGLGGTALAVALLLALDWILRRSGGAR